MCWDAVSKIYQDSFSKDSNRSLCLTNTRETANPLINANLIETNQQHLADLTNSNLGADALLLTGLDKQCAIVTTAHYGKDLEGQTDNSTLLIRFSLVKDSINATLPEPLGYLEVICHQKSELDIFLLKFGTNCNSSGKTIPKLCCCTTKIYIKPRTLL